MTKTTLRLSHLVATFLFVGAYTAFADDANDAANYQTFTENGQYMGLSGEVFAGIGWFRYNDDIESRVGFQWGNQPSNHYADFDVDTEAFNWGGTVWVPTVKVQEFPIYLDFGFHYLTAEDDEFNPLIRAQGTVNNVAVQYDTVIKTGNPWDNLNGQYVVPAVWGSDIRDARFDFDYSEMIVKIGLGSAIEIANLSAGPVVFMPKLSGLFGTVDSDLCYTGTTALNLNDPLDVRVCDDVETTRWGAEIGGAVSAPLWRVGADWKVGLDFLGELRFIYNDSELKAETRITGNNNNVDVREVNRFDETFGDIGGRVGIAPFVANESARLALIAEAEMWGVNQGALNNQDALDFDRYKRWSFVAGVRLTVDTDIWDDFSIPIMRDF